MSKELKNAGKSGNGDDLVECPVCHMPYLAHAVNQHLSQAAGKEAQYEMARLVYAAMEQVPADPLLGVVWESVDSILGECPHWKYLLDNPKVMPDSRPVVQKERWVRDNRIGRILDKAK